MLRWLIIAIIFLPFALAGNILVETSPDDETSQLELRNIILPNGEKIELWIVKASPVTITIDGKDTIVANEIEIDKANNVLRIIGYGVITTESETIRGENLVFELDSNVFRGNDVFVFTEAMDIVGTTINRVPGQIDVETGYFSPCSRCDQEIDDYGFNANNIELYPGDRLVAFDVVVLIKDLPVFYLPLVVFPLGPKNRRPNLTIKTATETNQANIFLDWPYVAGPNALGNFSIRYYADVDIGKGGFFGNKLLGGAVKDSYWGGELNHLFYTDTGKGSFSIAYTPAFYKNKNNHKEKTDELFKISFKYDTEEQLPILQQHFSISRDDSSRAKIVEYSASIKNTAHAVITELAVKGYADLDNTDNINLPSYSSPLQQLKLSFQAEKPEYTVGPFRLSQTMLSLGFFEDFSNPANRSAAILPIIRAARLLEQHSISLNELRPWTGFSIRGQSDFLGQYYSTDERLVNWNTNINLRQEIDTIGNFNISFVRNINEGETPFRFDTKNLNNTIFTRTSLELRPTPWLDFSISNKYIFLDNRRKDALGFDPIVSQFNFFGNVDWLSLSIANEYDIRHDDPGKLTNTLELRTPASDLEASLSLIYIKDLKIAADRLSGQTRDESEISTKLLFSVRPYLRFDLSTAYLFDPVVRDDKLPKEFYKDLVIGMNIGTEDQEDLIPELRISYTRDLNKSEMQSLDLSLNAAVQPVELNLSEGFNFSSKTLSSSEYKISWKNIAIFEASGFALVPTELFGLELNPNRVETWKFNLFEDRRDDNTGRDPRWRVSYFMTFENQKDKETKQKNTSLEVVVNLEEQKLDDVYFGVDLKTQFNLADDYTKINYLNSAKLIFFSDFYGAVGFQGSIAYGAKLRNDEIRTSTLKLDNLALTIKLSDELYFSTILNDTWTLIGTPENQTAYNFQPEFRVLWDRCCWLAYASWDSKTGTIKISITTPAGDKGISQDLQTDLLIPGNHKKQ